MIGSTMFTYALYAGMLRDAGLTPNKVTAYAENEIASTEDEKRYLRVETKLEVTESMKTSPKYGWGFTHVSSAYSQDAGQDTFMLRFRVFAQDGQTIETLGHQSSRLLLRLWDYNYTRLKNPHKHPYFYISVYLAKEGDTAGGEHSLGTDEDDQDENMVPRKSSMIHLFQIATLTDNLEKVRELAHEYGHATYPAVGTFTAPESWGNGYAAERIFIKWLYEDLKAKKLTPLDTMGATEEQLASYLANKVDPLVKRIGASGPNLTLLGGKSQESFNEYLALNSYAEAILPRPAFVRALMLGASDTGAGVFGRAVIDAAAEREELPITIPPVLKGQAMWVPLSKGTIKGAKVLERKGAWAKVQPTSATVIITNPPVD